MRRHKKQDPSFFGQGLAQYPPVQIRKATLWVTLVACPGNHVRGNYP